MGFLEELGMTLGYNDSKQFQQIIKEQGIDQFLKLYMKNKDLNDDNSQPHNICWGDEVEYQVINMNKQDKSIKLQTNTVDVFDNYTKYPESLKDKEQSKQYFEAKLEYGAWMVEATPDKPHQSIANIYGLVENLQLRRRQIQEKLGENDKLMNLSVFPLLGAQDNFFTKPQYQIKSQKQLAKKQSSESIELSSSSTCENTSNNSFIEENPYKRSNTYSDSQFSNDEIIQNHERFRTLTQNIRLRRQEKVNIQMPLYMDKNTNVQLDENEPFDKQIYMDAMSFGMGNSCLQLTFSTKNINHARYLYDQFSILSPFFLALSASSAVFKGKVSDYDVRWRTISQGVDDRTIEERDKNSEKYIPKSRYDTISYYLSHPEKTCICTGPCNHQKSYFKPEYNDLKFPVNHEIINYIKEKQKELGIELDENLLQHLGFLFVRDALVIFNSRINSVPENSTEHFENLQSTNWNNVRFKPPPSLDSNIPWRVEFRPLELQITDEENALFSYLIARVASLLGNEDQMLNFYIPISYADINFERAQKRNAILDQKFFFRKNIFDSGKPEIIEITLKDFFLGSNEFIGLEKLFENYFENIKKNPESPNYQILPQILIEQKKIFKYIKEKVEGTKKTASTWIREFIQNHKSYKQDSLISEDIAYDLLERMTQIQENKIIDENFLNALNFEAY